MESKHTPGPWHIGGTGSVFNADATVRVARETSTPEDAERIVACVNGCEGIDPEAVKDMYAALGAVYDADEDYIGMRQTVRAALDKADGR
jgi:hypothetical protein